MQAMAQSDNNTDDEILPAGTVLKGQYVIVKVLGEGNFGVVYQARDQKKGAARKRVAIKQMPMQMIVDCERQADMRAALVHPAIPRIYDYFAIEDYAYLIMELIVGRDLEAALKEQDGFLPERIVIGWAIQLCDALDYLHNHPTYPMIFRDIKPDNVMVDRNDRIHLVDFGLARVYPPKFLEGPQAQFEYLWKGLAIGTEGYSPPEQYQGYVKPQSDIYALGATLHHLLTKRDPRQELPFTFKRSPVRAFNPAVSRELEAIVMRAVDLDVESRYPTAREMKSALEALAR
jgi:serine/threonine protein kinase